MTEGSKPAVLWAGALWAALFCGIVTAWSPRYWATSVAITGVSIVIAAWMIASLPLWSHHMVAPSAGPQRARTVQIATVALIGMWGFLQIAFHTTVVPQNTLEESIRWALGGAVFLTSARILGTSSARRVFLNLLMWSLTALAVAAMLQYNARSNRVFGLFPAGSTVFGTFLSYNIFAAAMEFAAPIALWYAARHSRIAGAASFAIILGATFTADSRAGVILVLAEGAVAASWLIYEGKRRGTVILSVILSAVVVAGLAGVIGGTAPVTARFREAEPFALRKQLLNSTMKMTAERPWLGYGMGTWRVVYPRFASFDVARFANAAHNDWAQWTSDGGIVFLVLMMTLLLSISKRALRSIWGIGTISVMVHSLVDYPLRDPSLFFVWFALAGAVSSQRETVPPVTNRVRTL